MICNLLERFYTLSRYAKVTLKPGKDGIFLKILSHVFCLKSKGILTPHVVQTGKSRWGWTCIIHWFISQLHLKICCHFLPAFVNFTPCSITPSDQKTKFVIFYRHMQLPQLFQSHNVTGINARPIRGFHCTQLGTSSWHKGKC